MKKNIKLGIVIVSVLVIGITGVGFYVSNINRDKAATNPLSVTEENRVKVDEERVDTVVDNEDDLAVSDTVETKDSAFVINTEIEKVIESDKEIGSETIVNTDGDVVIINDIALVEAESNSKADDILADVLADVIVEDSNSKDKVYKAEVKVDTKDVKSEKELKKDYNSETASNKKNNDVEIDDVTNALFEEMGWDLTVDHSKGNVIPEGVSLDEIEGRVVPYEGKGNPFRTP
ncbi:hypothetical protein [Anaerocolumna sp.]|uniref:hypothetical protein n=1 Tax=Anaerocolumna sp. TaxID=2041569 RepID=UPI0028AF1953|nr:hypothetical protein [Anaerocolumna sp.]